MSSSARFSFDDSTDDPKKAIVLIIDVKGFTRFVNAEGADPNVPRFLSHLGSAVERALRTATPFDQPEKPAVLPPPDHWKFLGDGALYIWFVKDHRQIQSRGKTLFNRMWQLRNDFPNIVAAMNPRIPTNTAPRSIRCAITSGLVYPLFSPGSKTPLEYVGSPINLAARLQSFSGNLGLMVSESLGFKREALQDLRCVTVCCKRLRDFKTQRVYVCMDEYQGLADRDKDRYLRLEAE